MIRFKAKIVAFALGVAVACLSTGLAQIPIGNLPHATTPLSGSEVAVVNQNGVTRQVAVSAIGGTAKPAGSFQLPFQSGDIQWNNNGAFFATDQFIAGLSIPLPDGTNGAALLVGSGFGPGGSGHAGKAWILTDQAFDAVTPGNTLGITAGETQGSGTANGGLLWLLGGASFGGTGGETLIQGGTSANGAGGPTVVQGGNATGLGAGAIPGDLFLEGGQVGQQGANVHLIMTTLNGISGVVRIRNNSTPLWDFFANGSIFDYSGGGFGTSGQVLTSAGPGSPVTWSSPVVTGFGNRTNLIGLTANNGVAGTAARSDSTPALSQAISPVWTGIHVFAPTSGVGLQVQGLASNFAMQISGTTTANTSFGPLWQIGTSASDLVWRVNSANGATRYLDWFGDGGLVYGSATGGDKGLGTINATGLFVNGTAVSTSSGTPGGSSTQMQYNNAGAFGGTAGLTWTAASSTLAQTSSVTGTLSRSLTNSAAGTGNTAQYLLSNDALNLGLFGLTSSGFTGTKWTNGPSGPQLYLGTDGNFPVVVGSNSAAKWQFGSSISGEQNRLITNGTGSTSLGYNAVYDAAGTRFGYYGKASSSDSNITYESDAGLRLVGNNGTDVLFVDTSHNLTYNSNPVQVMIACTTACSAASLKVGQSVAIAKGSNTARASTTTLANDPDLQITNLPAGYYRIEFTLQFTATNSTGGSQWRLSMGTATQFEVGMGYHDCNTTTAPVVFTLAANSATPQTCTITSGSGVDINVSYFRPSVPAGTLSIQWAQNSSNASATNLNQNSSLMVTRIN